MSDLMQVFLDVAKGIELPVETITDIVKKSIRIASSKKYGLDAEIEVDIGKNGIAISRKLCVVDEINNYNTEILLDSALQFDPNAKVGDYVFEPLPPFDVTSTTVSAAKRIINEEISREVRCKQYLEFKDKEHKIVNVIVKHVEFGNVIAEIGSNKAEVFLGQKERIMGETIRIGDRLRVYIQQVRNVPTGYQIIVSRADPGFLRELFKQEIPEVFEGEVIVKDVSRLPGGAKVSVFSTNYVDPVKACVGPRGARIKAISNEIGEKIDVVEWSDDIAKYVVNIFPAIQINKIVLDEENRRIDVVMSQSQSSMAIGKGGRNVRLASKLIGWNIDILTNEQESEKRQLEMKTAVELFTTKLGIDDITAQLLVSESYLTLESLADTTVKKLTDIGIGKNIVDSICQKIEELLGIVIAVDNTDEIEFQTLQPDDGDEDDDNEEIEIDEEFAELFEFNEKLLVELVSRGICDIDSLKMFDITEMHKILSECNVPDDNIATIVNNIGKK